MVVNDVSGLNPVRVAAIVTPETVEDVCAAIRGSRGPISIGGGRYSMGGQTASADSLHLDMRRLNRVAALCVERKIIRVQAGMRWSDIQRALDPYDLSVKIMQTYANFTVGGSLGVNVHGRYVGLGPMILSVLSISVVLADGRLVEASPTENAEIFFGAIGGYGGIGVIVEAALQVTDNTRVERVVEKLPVEAYPDHFRRAVQGGRAVFHNADLYPPHFTTLRSVTWVETGKPATCPGRLMPTRRRYPLQRYGLWAVSETPFGKWRREFLFDPVLYAARKVHWRNYEAGYDVAELEPASRQHKTYLLQEYFVPAARFGDFVPCMAEILRRHGVNVLNVSVRHAAADPGSLLAWAREEVFAFVLYHKQDVARHAGSQAAVWTRELIGAALELGGSFYLPYQAHATPSQFHRAYPNACALFAIKRRFDPDFRFRNALWDRYYDSHGAPQVSMAPQPSRFRTVYGDTVRRDAFFRFLQNIFRLYPEDRFHALIEEACAAHGSDAEIYRAVQDGLPDIKPFLADLTFGVPALRKQQREMARQTVEILNGRQCIDGYVEIGTTGRYVSDLRDRCDIEGPVYLVNDAAPTNGPADILERGRLAKVGRFVDLRDYRPIRAGDIQDASVDLVSCYIGLHHAQPDRLDGFLRSIARVLRPGGLFVLREHDVDRPAMDAFVSLAHTVFNAGLGVSWKDDSEERRHFAPLDRWRALLAAQGFEDTGHRLQQAHDPSANTLMAFRKPVGAQGAGGGSGTLALRPGDPDIAEAAASLIYESSHELMDFMFRDRALAERVLAKLFRKTGGHFSHRFATMAALDGRTVGLELGYDRDQLAAQDLQGGLNLLTNSPVSLWPRLLTTVRSVTADYVPAPSEGAYYINNIAVTPDCRGHGVGAQLLRAACERAARDGYDTIELDVTETNDGAIGFYKAHGFEIVSRSGSADLHGTHGLPLLLRAKLRRPAF